MAVKGQSSAEDFVEFVKFAASYGCKIHAMSVPIEEVLRKYWGFEGFLPLQKEAMECVCAGRDSIVILPTGGGKSLCFQAPALTLPGLTLVVSPL